MAFLTELAPIGFNKKGYRDETSQVDSDMSKQFHEGARTVLGNE